MLNQAPMADIFDLAAETDIDIVRLFEALKLGRASSAALTLMNKTRTTTWIPPGEGIQIADRSRQPACRC
jgi:hypothetical protein